MLLILECTKATASNFHMTTVYVSSSFLDLIAHRDAVIRALRKSQLEVIGMEDYIATDNRPVTKCLDDVARTDIYIGLVAHRYGYVPPDDNPEHLSITEMEYRHAVKHQKPCLVFLHSEDDNWPPKFVELGDSPSARRLKALREELSQELVVSFFTTPDNLASLVVAAVRNHEQSRPVVTSPNHSDRIDVSLPDVGRLHSLLHTRDTLAEQLGEVIQQITNVSQLALHLFIATTIRSYDTVILREPPEYSKKVRPIKKLLSTKFANPSFATVCELADQCQHVVRTDAPDELLDMKTHLRNEFTLGSIGDFLDDLDALFPLTASKGRVVRKADLKKSLIEFVLPELGKHLAKMDTLPKDADWHDRVTQPSIALSLQALSAILDSLAPVFSQSFVVESLESVDSANRKYTLLERSYRNGVVAHSRHEVSFEALEHYEGDVPYILTHRHGTAVRLPLAPFVIVRDDSLCFYRRTRAIGYEYYSVPHDRPYIERTKRKFSHTVFHQAFKGSEQALFFTDVVPSVDPITGIRSNIPSEGIGEFVGRKRQKARITKEILDIPNQNGIVYGVGGVGKTALMIQMSRELVKTGNSAFTNIVWASAKTTYYNPTLDIVQERATSHESLDSVILTVLYFFDFEDRDGYSHEDKRELFLELLEEHQILLIIDNFETIAKPQQEEIIQFFEVDVKYKLRAYPSNFKLIITSRETIPSGFHPISLTGLDLREAKQLMSGLCKHYGPDHAELSDEQQEKLYRVTSGIPIVIKHTLGQIYERRKAFQAVVEEIPQVGSQKLVEFSYREILAEIKKDGCALDILLVLELMSCPLMSRQLADILGRSESSIDATVPRLANYQCIGRVNEGPNEKYTINPEIRLLTRSLVLQHPECVRTIKERFTRTFTLEKQMDYNAEELAILTLFDEYTRNGQYLEAEQFIKSELEKHPKSVLMKFRYAKYLKTDRHQGEQAIDLLESIREASRNHISVLRLLISCYITADIPNFYRAAPYVNEVEAVARGNDDLMLEVAEFYTRWSISKKLSKELSPDPLGEMLRQREYKDLADKALGWLKQISTQTHHVLYLSAQCHFNKWENVIALRLIGKAIAMCDPVDPCRSSYLHFERMIRKNQEWYEPKA
jgi:hypothetical protein